MLILANKCEICLQIRRSYFTRSDHILVVTNILGVAREEEYATYLVKVEDTQLGMKKKFFIDVNFKDLKQRQFGTHAEETVQKVQGSLAELFFTDFCSSMFDKREGLKFVPDEDFSFDAIIYSSGRCKKTFRPEYILFTEEESTFRL